MLLTRLCKEFNEHELKYAIAGGFAVALHGAIVSEIFILNVSIKYKLWHHCKYKTILHQKERHLLDKNY